MPNDPSHQPPPAASRGARRASSFELEPAHLELLRLFTAFRLATIADLYPLLRTHFTSAHHVWWHAERLTRAGYLIHPPAQTLRLYAKRGRPPRLYALATKGAEFLRANGATLPRMDHNAKARALKPYSLAHPLATTRALVPFLIALRAQPERFNLRTLFPDGGFHDRIAVVHRDRELELPIYPDATLIVEDKKAGDRLALFLEIDESTEPLSRKELEQSSFLKKVLAYRAYRDRPDRFTAELDAPEFLVLTVTATPSRAHALRAIATAGPDLFWFTSADELATATPDALRAQIWTSAAGDVGSLF